MFKKYVLTVVVFISACGLAWLMDIITGVKDIPFLSIISYLFSFPDWIVLFILFAGLIVPDVLRAIAKHRSQSGSRSS
ncbi:hypothetical protein DCC85_20600 [Paenibacillus sp. CAA11]|uniref:hypothetical protein n=1 Tax=Paenibacillus sp. CAA11 TaxID=1532905 RepID=UPI000D3B87A7|nr:hypothetical protein [Paenibacillus sp. CAA11]AWB46327.1 hypothetical protein DCC85_20600 [Paenibacillus sp. CAA11]